MQITEQEWREFNQRVKALNELMAHARTKTVNPPPMNGDPAEAAKALIRSFGLVAPASHSVYVQRQIQDNQVATVLKVHLNPSHPQSKDIKVPTQFQGFPVELEDWPTGPNAIYGG